MDSIQKLGLIHPIVISPADEKIGGFILVAGERRYRAMILLGWKDIPCTLREDLSDIEQKELELEENVKRKDLDWSEEIEILRQVDLLKREIHGDGSQGDPSDKGWTTKKTAELAGQDPSDVNKKINFAKLLNERPELKDQVKDLPISGAMKKSKQIIEGEKLELQHKRGEIELFQDLRLGDALELIKEIDSDSVDLILTDPPFGIPVIEEVQGKSSLKVQSYTAGLQDEDNLTKLQVQELFIHIIPEFERVLKPGAHFYIFFCFDLYPSLMRNLINNGLKPRVTPLIWYKGRPTSPFRGYDFSPSYEPLIFGHKPSEDASRKRLQFSSPDVMTQFSIDHTSVKRHPFQKPLDLMSELIAQSTQLGDLVLDPFAGGGSTLLAAKKLKRKAIGFEIQKQNFLIAQQALLLQNEVGEF